METQLEEVAPKGPPETTTEPLLPSSDASAPPPSTELDPAPTEEAVPELDAEYLSALGDTIDDAPTYGENIHQDLAQRWLPILRRGLQKETKEALLKEYAIPDNCRLLRAPSLNPEISAAVTDMTRARDKKLEGIQQQLGLGITAINKAMSVLLTGDDKQNKIQAIKRLSDGCRILTDLHFIETQSRIKLITPSLDKAFISVVQDIERDESLFGTKLSERIKSSKTIEKQSLQIKKGVATAKAPGPAPAYPSTSRPRHQGNWTAPPRYQQPSNRGGRGGAHKTPAATSNRKPAPLTTPAFTKASNNAKHRAPPRH